MGWPQIVLTGLIVFGAGISLAKNGEQKTDKYTVVDWFVSPLIVFTLLWFGGFYN